MKTRTVLKLVLLAERDIIKVRDVHERLKRRAPSRA